MQYLDFHQTSTTVPHKITKTLESDWFGQKHCQMVLKLTGNHKQRATLGSNVLNKKDILKCVFTGINISYVHIYVYNSLYNISSLASGRANN